MSSTYRKVIGHFFFLKEKKMQRVIFIISFRLTRLPFISAEQMGLRGRGRRIITVLVRQTRKVECLTWKMSVLVRQFLNQRKAFVSERIMTSMLRNCWVLIDRNVQYCF